MDDKRRRIVESNESLSEFSRQVIRSPWESRLGDSGECFTFIQDWVEKKVRRHMMRARNRKGFGWTRWSRQWLYTTLRLFNRYRVYRPTRKAAPA